MKNDIRSISGVSSKNSDSVSFGENWHLCRITSLKEATQVEKDIVAGSHIIPGNIESLPRWMWLHCSRSDQCVKAFKHTGPLGWDALIACFVHSGILQFTIGPMVLASVPVTRNIIRMLRTDNERQVTNGLVAIRRALKENDLIFMEGIEEHSVLGECLQNSEELRRNYHILAFGAPYDHHYLDLPETFDEYLGTLSATRRYDIGRTRRRLRKNSSGECIVEKYLKVEDIAHFVDDACAVSSTTWQYQQESAGLRNPQVLRDRFEHTARLGWFHGYLLRVDGKPVAFQVGHIVEGVYYLQELGYDPSWAKKQVGIYLLVAVIEDLISNEQGVHCFDFGYTDSLYKQRFSSRSSRESFYYLFPRTARMTVFWIVLRICIGVTDLARKILSISGPGNWILRRFGYGKR